MDKKKLSVEDKAFCKALTAGTVVSSAVICKVTDGIESAIGRLDWWAVRDVVERHVREARQELLGMAIVQQG